jgi:WD40 repeat protein
MDVDPTHHHHPHSHDTQLDTSNNHAYPSPLEGEQLPPPIPRTDGPEQGTQVDKVEELSPDTTFIRLMDDERSARQASETTATPSPSPVGAEHAPVLLQCEWNPRDPSMLAAAGTDALARVWTISRSPATASEPGKDGGDHVSPLANTLIDPDTPRTTTVTALSWTSDGTAIAVATDSGTSAAVSVWSADGVHMQTMEVSEPPVIKLGWNPSNTALLAISPEKGGALITVYSSATGCAFTYLLPGHDIGATPLDAAWTNDAEFLLSGGDLLLCLHCTDSSIVQVRKFETKDDDSFTQVLFDWRSKLAATSSDKGTLDVSDQALFSDMVSMDADHYIMTALGRIRTEKIHLSSPGSHHHHGMATVATKSSRTRR